MDKETEQFMLAQFFDVLEEVKRILNTCNVEPANTQEVAINETNKYLDKQLENIQSQLKDKELSKTDGKSDNK